MLNLFNRLLNPTLKGEGSLPWFHFFQNRKDTMGFILKVNDNKDILLNVVIQRDDYATPDALMDMIAIAIDAIIQDRPVVYK